MSNDGKTLGNNFYLKFLRGLLIYYSYTANRYTEVIYELLRPLGPE